MGHVALPAIGIADLEETDIEHRKKPGQRDQHHVAIAERHLVDLAPARRPAFHRLEQERIGRSRRQLEIDRDRRLEVSHDPRPHHLRLARLVALGESVVGGQRLDAAAENTAAGSPAK